MLENAGRLVVTCDDRPGVVAAVSRFLFAQGANITESDQYSSDPEGGRFFLRMAFHLEGLEERLGALRAAFAGTVAGPLGLAWRIHPAAVPKRVALMVSREDHCLLDLLWRARRGELDDADIGIVVSNHPDLGKAVASFGVPFVHVPNRPSIRAQAEARHLELLAGYDLVVLARYMQILSGDFLRELGAPVLNIHHSFLPAFAGADPYARAKERGVKLIGATAHYATEELDAGPIIEQDVIRVTHRADVALLARLGSDIERTVLRRAVQWHCDGPRSRRVSTPPGRVGNQDDARHHGHHEGRRGDRDDDIVGRGDHGRGGRRRALVRLFVALQPSAAARDALFAWTLEVVGDDPALRPVAPEAQHVTLAFLGELDSPDVAVEAVEGLEVGRLEGVRTAGVLWLARVLSVAVADHPALKALHDELCDALDVAPGHRSFRPHLTLARLRGRRRPASRDLPRAPVLDLEPTGVVLLRSHLDGTGGRPARYEELARAPVLRT